MELDEVIICNSNAEKIIEAIEAHLSELSIASSC